MKKQATDRESSMDMISQLPQPLLHHILSFFSQKIEFLKSHFPGDQETFESVVEMTLQRYHIQKLSVDDFRLEMSEVDSESISFLEKWIPLVMLTMCVKNFELSFISRQNVHFDMPSAVFESKALQVLSLNRCKLLYQNSIENVINLKHLKSLTLKHVHIPDKTLDMILSSCCLIEILVLHSCEGLKTIKLNKSHNNLKLFDFREFEILLFEDNGRSIEINAPALEKIEIQGCTNWLNLNLHTYLFPNLKSLYLEYVRLSPKSFHSFSYIFPCLEALSLAYCYGIEELHLSSPSVKSLIIECMDKLAKVVIDAPSLVWFQYEGDMILSISFKATASEWKSKIALCSKANFNDFDASSWCLEIYEMLKALSKSQISLDIVHELMGNEEEEEEEFDPSLVFADTHGGLCEPVKVELLQVRLDSHSEYSASVCIINLLHICRPRNMRHYWYVDDEDEDEMDHNLVTDFLEQVLVLEREMRRYSWQKDLELARMKEVWTHEGRNEVHFQLKWRD